MALVRNDASSTQNHRTKNQWKIEYWNEKIKKKQTIEIANEKISLDRNINKWKAHRRWTIERE